ncbi:hypothetical protein V8C26DRAFT_395302 [Trichoderma gracile]
MRSARQTRVRLPARLSFLSFSFFSLTYKCSLTYSRNTVCLCIYLTIKSSLLYSCDSVSFSNSMNHGLIMLHLASVFFSSCIFTPLSGSGEALQRRDSYRERF